MRLVLGIVAFAVVACAQAPSERPGRVEGQLVDESSGQGIRKGWLTLRATAANRTGYTAVSDSRGNFAFEAIEPGRYTLSAEHASYLRSAAKQITVAPGETLKAARITLVA